MNTALKAIDLKIQKLTNLRELASDPECLQIMRQIVMAVDAEEVTEKANQKPNTNSAAAKPFEITRHGSDLRAAVVQALKKIENDRLFTVQDTITEMNGFNFSGKPSVVVNGVFRKFLEEEEEIELMQRGSGRLPSLYRHKQQS